MRRNFNLIASVAAFVVGAAYMFSDGASVNANVIGASGGDAGLISIVGIVMIIGAMGLFITTVHNTNDNSTIKLEQLLRRNRNHEHLNDSPSSQEYQEIAKQEEAAKK